MTIVYRKGDVVKAAKNGEVGVLAHQCNCFNTMGSGIAKQIAKEFPKAFAEDQATIKGDRRKLGTVSWSREENGLIVVNLYGQYHYSSKSKQTDYEMLENSLYAMKLIQPLLDYRDLIKVGIPKIGCGLGGGDWSVVEGILKRVAQDECMCFFVYELDK